MIRFLYRAIQKRIFYPFIYGKRDDYNAKKYWHDRFLKYGDSILGPGNDAMTESRNLEMYSKAKTVFLETCRKENINFQKSRFCEIGLGTGFYTEILKEQNVQNYKGYDISDVVIPRMSKIFPDFSFHLKDISSEPLEDIFDVILLIDVIQHIVNDQKCRFAMENIRDSLAPGGVFLVGPLAPRNVKRLFYVRAWTIEDLKKIFTEDKFRVSEPIKFRNGTLYSIRKLDSDS
ncbi:MAG: class I SAM-dependent methyltransferase [Fibrobacter sp.]|jgi:SAM-dependent methyltransferase|nr:class I SAM-dependent methyltransferase [Fibrobacter sp.]HON11442.1 class I SAM-dependent methyltransferase [Chitinispirillaceae bacterium]